MPEEKKWIEKARDTYKFHRLKVTIDDRWNVTKTAKSLKRSLGSVNEDLMIARWLKTHENQIIKFDYAYEALKWIRRKKKEIELE